MIRAQTILRARRHYRAHFCDARGFPTHSSDDLEGIAEGIAAYFVSRFKHDEDAEETAETIVDRLYADFEATEPHECYDY